MSLLSPAQIAQVVSTFEQSAAANLATVGRSGSLLQLPQQEGGELLLAGDLHGARDNFDRLLQMADLENQPLRHLVVQEVCHGGPRYASGGCRSHELLEHAARLKVQFPDRFHFLLSNHELAEATEHPIFKRGRILNVLFRCGMHARFGDAVNDVREAMCQFLTTCPLAIRLPNRVWISHSVPPDVDQQGFDTSVFGRRLTSSDMAEGGAAFRLVWGRDYRAENADAFATIVDADLLITGHEPCETGRRAPSQRQLILDSCCAEPSCLMLALDQPCSIETALACVRPL